VLLGAFLVLGYTGLFERIETQFYNQRILDNKEERIEDIQQLFSQYNNYVVARFENILSNGSFTSVFALNQKSSDINERNRIVGTLEDELIGFQYMRIVDFTIDSQKIHYSSYSKDRRSQSSDRIVYFPWRNSEDYIENFVVEDVDSNLTFNDKRDSLIYRIPVYDDLGLKKGLALVYFSSRGFKDYLFQKGVAVSEEMIQLHGSSGVLIDLKEEQKDAIAGRLDDILAAPSGQLKPVSSSSDLKERYYLMSRSFDDLTFSIVIKESELELNPLLVFVLLTLLFSSVFLCVFLLLNIRQDRSLIIASRIKKFQLNFLIDYLDNKNELDWEMWEREMRARRDQVRKEFKKGLGRFKQDEEDQIDKLIDSNWDEIISVLSRKKEEKQEDSNFDLKKVEQIIQKALKNVNITIPQSAVVEAPHKQVRTAAPVPVDVEELTDEDNLEELEDLGEPIAVEDVSDEEGLEELEDLGEPIAVEDVSDEEGLEELEDLGEPIAVEDVSDEEGLEELEDLGEPIAVEDVSDEEGLEELEDLGEPIAVDKPEEEITSEETVQEEYVTEEELEELLPAIDVEELPLLEVEELDSIPVLAGLGEASLEEMQGKSDFIDFVDFSGGNRSIDNSDYYSEAADLVELEGIESDPLRDPLIPIGVAGGDSEEETDLTEIEDLEAVEDLQQVEHLEAVQYLEYVADLEDVEDLEPV